MKNNQLIINGKHLQYESIDQQKIDGQAPGGSEKNMVSLKTSVA
jgi:hypothetical protein